VPKSEPSSALPRSNPVSGDGSRTRLHSKDAKSPKQHSGQRIPSPNRTAQGACDNEDPSVFTLREFRAFADAFLGKVSVKKTQVGALLGFRCTSMS
jgi:hypothetical protein